MIEVTIWERIDALFAAVGRGTPGVDPFGGCVLSSRLIIVLIGFCRVSDAVRVGLPDESNNGRVIGGERNDNHERRKKRDQAAAISTGHHAAVRQVRSEEHTS